MKYYIFLKDVNQVLFIPYSHLVTVCLKTQLIPFLSDGYGQCTINSVNISTAREQEFNCSLRKTFLALSCGVYNK